MNEDRRHLFSKFKLKQKERSFKVIDEIESFIKKDELSIFHDKYELASLYELALGLHDIQDTEGHIIHCGMYRGGSFCTMGVALQHNQKMLKPVIGVDPYVNAPVNWIEGIDSEWYWDEAYRLLRKNMHHFGLNSFCLPVVFDDLEFFKIFSIPARIIFIDTYHIYEHLKAELQILTPMLVNNGWIVIHDYWATHEGIIRALNEFMDTQTNYNLIPYCLEVSPGKYSSMVIIQANQPC